MEELTIAEATTTTTTTTAETAVSSETKVVITTIVASTKTPTSSASKSSTRIQALISKFGLTPYITKVPKYAPLTREQFDQWCTHWPSILYTHELYVPHYTAPLKAFFF